MAHGQAYTSGDWKVSSGKEEDFIAEWTRFTKWGRENATGAISFRLLRDAENPSHFTSYGEWDSEASIKEWRNSGGFTEGLAKVRSYCDDFQATDYTLAATPDH